MNKFDYEILSVISHRIHVDIDQNFLIKQKYIFHFISKNTSQICCREKQ